MYGMGAFPPQGYAGGFNAPPVPPRPPTAYAPVVGYAGSDGSRPPGAPGSQLAPPLPPMPRAAAALAAAESQTNRDHGQGGAPTRPLGSSHNDAYSSGFFIPENSVDAAESVTIHCTGIPHFVKEQDLFRHFKEFGRIVSLKLVRNERSPEDVNADRKIYNECFIQYLELAQAQKCINSPKSVLDNRFIKLAMARYNIVDPATVSHEHHRPQSAAAIAKENQKKEVQKRYEDLKLLISKEEDLLKRQEELLQVLILGITANL